MIDRRSFAKLATAGAITLSECGDAIAALTGSKAAGPAAALRKPKRLAAGDTLGLVLPASRAFESDDIAFAKEQLEAIGFRVKIGAHAYDAHGYFAGRDADRAADINAMFADDSVAGIVCYTGGWGSPRILPLLDYDLIARTPKVFIGYSDITALLNAIHQRTGLVTFHGPVGGSTLEPYTLENFRRVLMSPEAAGLLEAPPKKATELVDKSNRVIRIAPGVASGPLAGGNLTMVASLMGTPFELDTAGKIVFLEDVREDLYRIDRMLTQLALAGKFAKAAGVVFGRCSECAYKGPTFSLEEILRDRFGSLPIPVISGLSFGHIDQKLVLPVGARATLDAGALTLRIDEAAVI